MRFPPHLMNAHRARNENSPYLNGASLRGSGAKIGISGCPEGRCPGFAGGCVWTAFLGLVPFDVEQLIHRSLAQAIQPSTRAEAYEANPTSIAHFCATVLAPLPTLQHVPNESWLAWPWQSKRDWIVPLIAAMGLRREFHL